MTFSTSPWSSSVLHLTCMHHDRISPLVPPAAGVIIIHTIITNCLERLVLVKQLSWQPCLLPPLPPAPMRYCPLLFSSCHRFQNAMIFATEILPTSLFSCHFLQQQCLLPKWKYYKRLMNIFLKILIADKKTLLLLICGLKEGRLYKVSQGLNGVLAQIVCLPKNLKFYL